ATGFSGLSINAGSNGTFNQFEGLGGNDTITGNGNTRISYIGATGGGTVNFTTGTAIGDSSVGTESFTGVNSVQGSNFDDSFVFVSGSSGAYTIVGFVAGAGTVDRIELDGIPGINSFADVMAHASPSGSNTVINFGGGYTITLSNVSLASLSADDFVIQIFG